MTLLANLWQAESRARAERATAAVRDGKATEAQATRDAMLCRLIANAIANGFAMASRDTVGDGVINAHADAAELIGDIARKAMLEAFATQPPLPDAWQRKAWTNELARRFGTAHAIIMANCWIAHQLEAKGWPANGKDFDPGTPPPRWRLPVSQRA